MKNDFKKMEEEMDNLSIKMSAITAFNDKISNTLQEKRLQITKLSGVHALLRKVCKLCRHSCAFVTKRFFSFVLFSFPTRAGSPQKHDANYCRPVLPNLPCQLCQ